MYLDNLTTIFEHTTKSKTYKGFQLNCLNLNCAEAEVLVDSVYGREVQMVKSVLRSYPNHHNRDIIAMKISLIDVTNSTHLHQYKCLLDLVDVLCDPTLGFDKRIKDEKVDFELVKDIASATSTNLFSFASKYCHYHRLYLHGKDDYPKFDTIVSYCLPQYISYYNPSYRYFYAGKNCQVTQEFLYNIIRHNKDYAAFNFLIEEALRLANIPLAQMVRPKTKFDYLMWYANRS